MSRMLEDSMGNFWEIFDDGFVSKNGEPFGQLNSFNEIHSFDGNEVYVINIHNQIVRLSDNGVVGRFIGNDYIERTGSKKSPAGGVFPGGSGCCGVLLGCAALVALPLLGIVLLFV